MSYLINTYFSYSLGTSWQQIVVELHLKDSDIKVQGREIRIIVSEEAQI